MGEIDLVALLIQIVVGTVIIAPVLWLAGRALVGKEKAKFLDAVWIVLLGTVIGAVVGALVGGFGGLVAAVIMFIIWLALIKHFFDCGWLMAFAIAIIAVIIFVVIVVILAIIGIGLLLLAT
ncbi:MAG: hypothetical protein OEY81_07340 [Candidatus Bathyarchaeota archaeon]|nr:hypothetical protein [Candidatus Bathyarchaeota archaeon]